MFVIKDKNVDLYVSYKPYRLAQIEHVRLFESVEEAKFAMTNIINSLTWNYLEQKYDRDKWDIDIGIIELNDAMNLFRNLEIVKVNINEST